MRCWGKRHYEAKIWKIKSDTRRTVLFSQTLHGQGNGISDRRYENWTFEHLNLRHGTRSPLVWLGLCNGFLLLLLFFFPLAFPFMEGRRFDWWSSYSNYIKETKILLWLHVALSISSPALCQILFKSRWHASFHHVFAPSVFLFHGISVVTVEHHISQVYLSHVKPVTMT